MNTDPKQSARPCGCDPGANYTAPSCVLHNERPAVTAEEIYQGLLEIQNVPTMSAPIDNISIVPTTPNRCTTLPTDPAERKKYPIFSGVLAYFPDAIAAVAHVSWNGNNQHNPGQPLHWARGKSMDQEDTMVRHLMESGGGTVSGFDEDGQLHSVKMAWRALAKAQLEIEDLQRKGLYPRKRNA